MLGVFTVPVKGLEIKKGSFFLLQPLIMKISFFGRIQIVGEYYANNATPCRE
jgi:hypothetical protein